MINNSQLRSEQNLEENEDEMKAFQQYIDIVNEEIATSFIQKRIEEGRIQEDHQQEIHDLVQEIAKKEEQLQGLSEMSSYLMEKVEQNNDEFNEYQKQMENNIIEYETEIEFKNQSANQYKKLFNEASEKIDNLQDKLYQIENENFHYKQNLKQSQVQVEQMQRNQSIQEQDKQNLMESMVSKMSLDQKSQELEMMKKQLNSTKMEMMEVRKTIKNYQNDIAEYEEKQRRAVLQERQFQQQLLYKDTLLQDLEKQLHESNQKVLDLNTKVSDLKQFTSSQVLYFQTPALTTPRDQQVPNLFKAAKRSQAQNHESDGIHTQESQENHHYQHGTLQDNNNNLLSEIEDLGVHYELHDDEIGNTNLVVDNNLGLSKEFFKQKNPHPNEIIIEDQVDENQNGNEEEEEQKQNKKTNKKQMEIQIEDQSNLENFQNASTKIEVVSPKSGQKQQQQQKIPEDQFCLLKDEDNLNSSVNYEDQQNQPQQQQSTSNNPSDQKNKSIKHPLENGKKKTHASFSSKPTAKIQQLINKKRTEHTHNKIVIIDEQNNDNYETQSEFGYERRVSEFNPPKMIVKKQQQQKETVKRRDPYEEFFNLTSQCVKLNSEYMDEIIHLDTNQYYKEVRDQCIPYHKWYQYVDKQLTVQRNIMYMNDNQELQAF